MSSYIPVEELGLSARDVPALVEELSGTSQASQEAKAEVRTDRLSADELQAFALDVRRKLRDLPDEALEGERQNGDKRIQMMETMFNTASNLRTLLDGDRSSPPVDLDSLIRSLGTDALVILQHGMIFTREVYAELERRAAERLRAYQARQRKLDAMLGRL